jgi:hypothetical protein
VDPTGLGRIPDDELTFAFRLCPMQDTPHRHAQRAYNFGEPAFFDAFLISLAWRALSAFW